ncbi:Glutamine--tRNA ligase [Thermosinus carboxydivorans Nor1]|uniref:Glutamine--tRNA ligase n=1 Tax=Thermosinus carboxydivorans Nor1 TaxID=401526 RepID=A1HQV4_9FIRM|nr:Glutamine--tRNA ligase [Thermosinus carboxydivorans Nor1]
MSSNPIVPSNFIQEIINEDLKNNTYGGRVHTRFPPEPNGYLHIGHAKSICLNFGLAKKYGGLCNLRFDDTNPSKEEVEYVQSIINDVKWLGFDWEDRMFYASDYFDQLYEFALKLIRDGKAYVCDLSPQEIREYRGTLTQPGKESPYRNRSVEENLDLFQRMKAGEFPDGSRVLRAKIDMASPNLNMRDPVCTGLCGRRTIARAINGAFIPCTTMPILYLTHWKALPTLSAPWSLKTIGRCMTGCLKLAALALAARNRSSSPGLI